jgi:hypothetical protein
LGKFWLALEWKTLGYFMIIWGISRPFVIFYGHLVFFRRFGLLSQEKSGNPDV